MVCFSGKSQERKISSGSCRTVAFADEQCSISCAHWPSKGRILSCLLCFPHLCPSGSQSLPCSSNLRPQPHCKGAARSNICPKNLCSNRQRARWCRSKEEAALMLRSSALRPPKSPSNVLRWPSGQASLDINWGCQPSFVVNCESSPRHPSYCPQNHVCFLVSDCGAMFSSRFQFFLCNRRPRSMGSDFFF